MRHIPRANLFAVIKAFVNGKPVDQIAQEITLPAANQTSHGLYFRLHFFGWSVCVTRPETAKYLLMHTDIFPKLSTTPAQHARRGTVVGKLLLGENVVLLAGKSWKEQRKIVSPAFQRSLPVQVFGKLTQKMVDIMSKEMGAIDVYDITQRWALDVLGEAAFGFHFQALEDRDNEWVTRYNYIIESAQKPLYFIFPSIERHFWSWIPERRKAHQEVSKFLNMMSKMVQEKREALGKTSTDQPSIRENEKDLLTLMIEAEREGQGRLTDEELLSNLCMLFLAGHESTASAVSLIIYHLAVHPDIQQRAREEAIRIFGDNADILPTIEQTRELKYINMVIKETLRISSPGVSMMPRVASQDTELSGVFIPKGTRLAIDMYDLHHNPKVWKNPKQFDPERFAPGGEAEKLGGMPWAPFGGGERQCVGMNFSLIEQRISVSMLLRKYEWCLPEDSIHKEKLVTRAAGIIKPLDLFVLFTKRY
ncbi:cytochrome P450 [Zychaea mexicana]|uniref:cytochrome P450 n=1 Tax=Zychaea mexicana TaxID=64656 RepID=UPI0022FF244C|nr:cytochrome P450 [Zychaea mexicana]KAI9493100.1 cytochrome P450 [Zychaea mexicana]